MRLRSSVCCVVAMVLSALVFARPLLAAEPAAKNFFPPDAVDAPAYVLPDPLTSSDGKQIASREEWQTIRRPEILELFRKHVYGRVPSTPYQKSFKVVAEDPHAMDGAATLKQVDVTITANGKSLTIRLVLFVPNKVAKPVPAFLLICNREPENIDPTRKTKSAFWPAEEAIARGYAIAAFHNADVDPDKNDGFHDGIHGLLDGEKRPPDAWGTIAAWAWGASRCMDYLENDKDIARDKVAVIGHSRGGKTALWAGAEDERFAMVCSNDSGCGGAALSRRQTKNKETVAQINKTLPHWFNENFKNYGGRENELPVDQHMLVALIAPRAVCVASADQDLWADPRGEFLSVLHAGPAYRLFGKTGIGESLEMPAIGEPIHGDGAHYHIREGKHDLTLADWNCYMDFADKLFAKPAMVKASSFGFDPVDSTRTLQAAINSGATKVIVDNPGKPWIVTPIVLADNQEIIFEKGVEVLAKEGAFKGGSDCLFSARGKQNIVLSGYGATLRMRRSDYAKPPYQKAEWRHVLSLCGCTHVRVEGLTLAESGGDGIYLGTVKGKMPCKDILIKDVVCDKNYRQGISVINAENLLIEDCTLSNTAGTGPAAGIDFEPNTAGERLVNCAMRRCVTKNNEGGGYLLCLMQFSGETIPLSMRFEQCQSIGDRRAAVNLVAANSQKTPVQGDIEFTDCVFQSPVDGGIQIHQKPASGCRVRFERCSLLDVAAQKAETPIEFTAAATARHAVGGVQFGDLLIRNPRPGKIIAMHDAAGDVALENVGGNLVIENAQGRNTVAITAERLVEWNPSLALRSTIPRLPLDKNLKPAADRTAAKPDAMAFAKLRDTARLVFFAAQGDDVHLRVRYGQYAKYGGSQIALTVTSPSDKVVSKTPLPFNEETEIRVKVPETGLYRMAADPGINLFQVLSSSHPVSLNLEDGPAHLLGTSGEFFFQVPAGVERFSVRPSGDGSREGVKVLLMDPRGKVVQECDDVATVHPLEVTRAKDSPAEIWSFRLSRPKTLTLEDHFIGLRGVPPVVSASREGVLAAQ